MIIRNIRKFLLFLFFFLPFFSHGAIIVDSPSVVSIDDETINVSFRIFSTEYIQPGINYEISLWSIDGNQKTMVSRNFFKKNETLTQGSVTEEEFVLEKSGLFPGKYEVLLSIINDLNFIIDEFVIGEIFVSEKQKDVDIKDIVIGDCSIRNKDNSFSVGSRDISFNSFQDIKLSCKVYNFSEKDVNLNFNLSVNENLSEKNIYKNSISVIATPFSSSGFVSTELNLNIDKVGKYDVFLETTDVSGEKAFNRMISKFSIKDKYSNDFLKNVYFEDLGENQLFENGQISGFVEIGDIEQYYNNLTSENGFNSGGLYFNIEVFDKENKICESGYDTALIDNLKNELTIPFKLALGDSCEVSHILFSVFDGEGNTNIYSHKLKNKIEEAVVISDKQYIYLIFTVLVLIFGFIFFKKSNEIK